MTMAVADHTTTQKTFPSRKGGRCTFAKSCALILFLFVEAYQVYSRYIRIRRSLGMGCGIIPVQSAAHSRYREELVKLVHTRKIVD